MNGGERERLVIRDGLSYVEVLNDPPPLATPTPRGANVIRTLLMPAELLWRATPRRWAVILTGLAAAGMAVGWVAVEALCPPDCDHP